MPEARRGYFDELVEAWSSSGVACLTAAVRMAKEHKFTACGEGTACFNTGRFFPCNAERAVSAPEPVSVDYDQDQTL